MIKPEDIRNKILISDIIRGFSEVSTKYGTAIIKHLSLADSSYIDIEYQIAFEKAVQRGLPTNEAQLNFNLQKKYWTETEEKDWTEKPSSIAVLKQTRSKLFLLSDRKHLTEQIDKEEKLWEALNTKREHLLGYTAEVFALKKMNEYFVYFSFRKGSQDVFLFTREEFDALDEIDVTQLIEIYNKLSQGFTSEHIKKLALFHSFLNMMFLNGDSIRDFFGKPTCQLTHYQLELFAQGRFFKQAISEAKGKIPEDLYKNPDKLIEYLEASKQAAEVGSSISSSEAAGTAIVGATKKDLANLGLDANTVNLNAEAEKKGGSLSMEDLIKLHGL